MVRYFFLILLSPLFTFAQVPGDLALTAFQKNELVPEIQNVFELELMSRKRTYVINGVQFENGISIPDVASRGNIPCSFEVRPSPVLSAMPYHLSASRFWSEGHGNVLTFISGSDYFIVICYKLKGEVTFSELNEAFAGLVQFKSLKEGFNL